MTNKTESNELNLNKTQLAISEHYQKTHKDKIGDDGNTEVAKDYFKSMPFPEGISVESIAKHQAFMTDATIGISHGNASLGQDFLKRHKKVEEVGIEKLFIGKDSIRTSIRRTHTVSVGGKESTKHGWVTTKLTTGSAGTGGAAFGRVRSHFAEQGAALFSDAK